MPGISSVSPVPYDLMITEMGNIPLKNMYQQTNFTLTLLARNKKIGVFFSSFFF